ncbi:MAG: hypothetical protein AAFP84_17665, partial [Actinomycetota bacterium]
MSELDDLLDRVGTDRVAETQLADLFSEWWPDRDDRAHAVLDALAVAAPTNTGALELLLALID